MELLDNQRFARGTMPDRKQLEAVMVRRLKSELPKKLDGSDRFPKRILEALGSSLHRRGKGHPRRPAAIHQAAVSQTSTDNAEKFATEFVLKTLKKRLFSSPAAFAATLEQHEKSAADRQAANGHGQAHLLASSAADRPDG